MRFRCSSQVGSTLLLGLACLYSAPVPRTRRQSTADAAGDLLTCVGQPDPLYKHMHELPARLVAADFSVVLHFFF